MRNWGSLKMSIGCTNSAINGRRETSSRGQPWRVFNAVRFGSASQQKWIDNTVTLYFPSQIGEPDYVPRMINDTHFMGCDVTPNPCDSSPTNGLSRDIRPDRFGYRCPWPRQEHSVRLDGRPRCLVANTCPLVLAITEPIIWETIPIESSFAIIECNKQGCLRKRKACSVRYKKHEGHGIALTDGSTDRSRLGSSEWNEVDCYHVWPMAITEQLKLRRSIKYMYIYVRMPNSTYKYYCYANRIHLSMTDTFVISIPFSSKDKRLAESA